MKIKLHRDIKKPIYEQIKDQIKDAVLSGDIEDNTLLPSIRLLADELDISFLTVRRAYEELSDEGLIVSKVGKGSFITLKNFDSIRESKIKLMESKLAEVYKIADSIGIVKEDLLLVTKILFDEIENHNANQTADKK